MEAQAVVGREPRRAGEGIVPVDVAEGLEHEADLGGEVVDHVDEVAARMGQAVGEDGGEVARGVGGQPVAHLDGRPELGRSLGQDGGQILARVLAAGEEQGDPVRAAEGDGGRGGHAGPAGGVLVSRGGAPLRDGEGEALHDGVVVVDELALRRLTHQFREDEGEPYGGIPDELPLGGGGQRDAQPRCKTSMRWKGRPAPYLSRPTMLEAVSSYRAAPTPAGAGAVKTSPQRLQRRRSHS